MILALYLSLLIAGLTDGHFDFTSHSWRQPTLMLYDVIFTTITQIIPFPSPSLINLALPLPISLSYSLLKTKGACLLGVEKEKTEGKEKVYLVY